MTVTSSETCEAAFIGIQRQCPLDRARSGQRSARDQLRSHRRKTSVLVRPLCSTLHHKDCSLLREAHGVIPDASCTVVTCGVASESGAVAYSLPAKYIARSSTIQFIYSLTVIWRACMSNNARPRPGSRPREALVPLPPEHVSNSGGSQARPCR